MQFRASSANSLDCLHRLFIEAGVTKDENYGIRDKFHVNLNPNIPSVQFLTVSKSSSDPCINAPQYPVSLGPPFKSLSRVPSGWFLEREERRKFQVI